MRTHSPIPSGLAQRAEPETFRARSISASLAVKDLEKSLAWYRDRVGFFVEDKIQRGGKLSAFTLQFTTTQDIDALAEAIKQRGGRLESGPENVSGIRMLRLRDPDGFKLVISAAR